MPYWGRKVLGNWLTHHKNRCKNTKYSKYKRPILQVRKDISGLEQILFRRNSHHENSYIVGFSVVDCYSPDLNSQLFIIKRIKLVSHSTLLWLNSKRYFKNILLFWQNLYWKERTSFIWITLVSFVNKMLLKFVFSILNYIL